MQKEKKTFDKIQHSFIIKSLDRLSIERAYLNIIKVIHNIPTGNIILNEEKQKALPLRSSIIQRCPLSPLLFNTVLEVLASTIRQDKEKASKQENKN